MEPGLRAAAMRRITANNLLPPVRSTLTRNLLLLLALLPLGVRAEEPRPNIVFILADDLGGHDIGCYGSTFHKTPHLDALAKRGMKFTNAYSASPLCSPTRASILTGLSPARIGITAPNCHLPEIMLEKRLAKGNPKTKVLTADSITRLKTDYLTLPEVLRDAGWRTAHFGKWHLGAEPYSPLQHGFEIDLPHTPGPGPGGGNGYFAPWAFWKNQGKPGDHIEDRMAEEAVKFLRENKDRPFLLNYWAFSVHSPWMAKETYIADAAKQVDPKSGQRNPMYAGMVRSLDDAVGRLVATLDELKLADHTLIIFTSDNGGWHNVAKEATSSTAFADVPVTSNAPYRSGKASNYEGGTRVPMIVVWPGKVAPGTTSDAVVQSSDFFPTLLELTSLPQPAGLKFDGASIAPALRGEQLTREAIYSHFPHGGRSDIDGFRPGTWVRRGDWKLIRFYADNEDGSDKLELYNLKDDISESKNQAAEKPALAQELNALITKFLTDTAAVVPKRNPQWNPSAPEAPAVAKKNPAKDPLAGWKARQCDAAVKDGIVSIKGNGPAPFLGFAAGKMPGPLTVKLRVRSASGGEGKVECLPTPADAAKAKSSPFQIPAGDWHELTVQLPVTGPLGILRLYLPAQKESLDLDWVEIHPATGKDLRTDF